MNTLESLGIILIGIGCLSGSIVTTQELPAAVLLSVIVVITGVIMTLFGKTT
jgi:hypothetical protein